MTLDVLCNQGGEVGVSLAEAFEHFPWRKFHWSVRALLQNSAVLKPFGYSFRHWLQQECEKLGVSEFPPPNFRKAATFEGTRVALETALSHRAGSFGRDGEDRRQRGHNHPQLGLAAVLAPRGVVDASRRGVVDAYRHLVVRDFQHRGRLPLELGDHACGNRQTEQVAGDLLDLSLAETVTSGKRGEHGLQIRPEASPRDSRGEISTRGRAAFGAAQAMESVLVDQRLDLGQFGDLVNQGSRVITDQGVAAAAAIRGSAIGDRAHLLRWNQAPQYPAMSRLATPFPTGGRGGRLTFQANGIRRRRLGGIGGIELEPGLQIADALLQFGDPSLEGSPRPPGWQPGLPVGRCSRAVQEWETEESC